MAKYRKIPIIVDAIQYTGELKPVKDFLGIKDAEYDEDSRRLIISVNMDMQIEYDILFPINIAVSPSQYILKFESGRVQVLDEIFMNKYFEVIPDTGEIVNLNEQ